MFRSSFNRPNLSYKVQFGGKSQDAKIKEIAQMISDRHSIPLGNSRTAKCGIIYCTAKLTAETVAEKLNLELDTILGPSRSRRVKPYHAGFTKEEREAIQQDWTAGNVPIVVATIAFGMGINKPDVRFVVHFNMPKSLEGYLQESGRAGRDGQPAECVIYYNWNDVIKLKKMLQDEEKREEAIERGATSEQFDIQQAHSLESLHAMAAFCQEPHRCRREMMLEYFNEKFERSECKNTCDNCQKLDGLQLKYVDQTESAKTVIQILEYLAKKQEASKSNEASLGTVRSIFYGDKEVEGKYDSSIIGIGKVFKFPKKEMERLIRTMITEVSS